ncbi:MAG: rhodanese-like domain-containing protein [Deltaproteobacteria bacterium]|nr:rhodanese-like domain-containing protein [Deltaproteobacteria bacterium]
MLKKLIKLQLKVALYPLKMVLKAAGLYEDEATVDIPPRPAPNDPMSSVSSPGARTESAPPANDVKVLAKDVLAQLSDGEEIVFLDVREANELAASGTIGGAVHMPLRDVPRRFEELNHGDTIVVYCAAGMRSLDAAMFLRDKGFDGARSLVRGLPSWTAAGGEVTKG